MELPAQTKRAKIFNFCVSASLFYIFLNRLLPFIWVFIPT